MHPAVQIEAVSQRLLQLHALLGGGSDVDVIWMVVREPQLLTADPMAMMGLLIAMKIAAAASTTPIDVVKVVERQPSLLLANGVEGLWDSQETMQVQSREPP